MSNDLRIRLLTVEIEEPSGLRADQAVLRALAEAPSDPAATAAAPISRRRLKESFRTGDVRLVTPAGPRALDPATRLGPGRMEIELHNFNITEGVPLPGPDIPTLYEDDELLILNKPSGLPSVPHAPDDPSAVGSALARFPSLPVREGQEGEPGLLHRLDTGTSGLLVFAKTPEEWARLKAHWREGGVRKIYRAWVTSANDAKTPPLGRIEFPLGHDAKSAKRMVARIADRPSRKIRGKWLPARTEILEARPLSETRLDLTILIETGVMHQIRCHLSALGWPILGDLIYGGASASRLHLHAWRIEIPLLNGARLVLETAMPIF